MAVLTFAWKLTVKDAYQNIAKNTDVLTRSNVAEFDRLLHWANGANVADREAALRYACAAVAETARPVRPMPKLNRSALTFSRVVGLLHGLLATPSGGTFEQFAVAAFLDILVVNHSEGRISEPYAIRGASNESLSRRPPNRQHLRPSGRPSGGLFVSSISEAAV